MDLNFGKSLCALRTTRACGSTFSTVDFMKSKYRWDIPNENLAAKLRHAINVKYIPESENLVPQSKISFAFDIFYLMISISLIYHWYFYVDYMLT